MIYGQQDFFSSNLVGRIFFYSSAIIFFYYICAACNFFLPTRACRNFFFNITHPLPEELNGRPLIYFCGNSLQKVHFYNFIVASDAVYKLSDLLLNVTPC